MNATTIGLSPKLIPSVIGIAVGIIVALFVDKAVGLGILGTAVASLSAGYVAPAGAVAIADPEVAPDAHPDDAIEPLT